MDFSQSEEEVPNELRLPPPLLGKNVVASDLQNRYKIKLLMKNFGILALLIFSVFAFSGCKDDECPSCLNGGTCNDGACDCAPGFTGDNCSNTVTLTITRLELKEMPFTNPATSNNWDEENGPDVYFELKDDAGNVLYTHDAASNLDAANLPVTYTITIPVAIANLNTDLLVAFYDNDDGEDFFDFDDDFIGSVEFHL